MKKQQKKKAVFKPCQQMRLPMKLDDETDKKRTVVSKPNVIVKDVKISFGMAFDTRYEIYYLILAFMI